MSQKIKHLVFIILILFGIWCLKFGNLVKAEIDCLSANPSNFSAGDAEYCSNQLDNLLKQYLPAQTNNKKNLVDLQSQLNNLNKRITALSNQLKILSNDITKRQEKLAFVQEIFNEKTREQYTFLRLYDPITTFLMAKDATDAFKEISFRQKAADSDRKMIEEYARDIDKLKSDEKSLQKSKDSLAVSQKVIQEKTSFLASEVAKVDAYLATVSAKQQAFLAAKLESLGLSRSAYNMKGGCSSDINPFKNPGFSPAIGFFSFGVPNRVGMNQFGAKGRAEVGQNYTQILNAYYNADIASGYNQGANIRVSGTNEFGQSFNDTWNIDDYLKHLYEMPTDFPMEALKAQVIAARSYALAYTNNGSGSICPSQKCQVVKREINNGTWQAAVDATKGIVLTNGGQPIKAWFSSTHGGYAYTSGDIGWNNTAWTKRLQDSTGGINNFSDLFNNAYDRSSPTFYCDWGSRSQYNKTAWLKPDEIADIANVILLAKADGSTQKHLAQLDKPNPDGVDTWDVGRVKSELSSRGITPLETASDISVSADFGSGKTSTVNINGRSFNGQDFKTYFNLRAPATIQIVGPLYNVEKR